MPRRRKRDHHLTRGRSGGGRGQGLRRAGARGVVCGAVRCPAPVRHRTGAGSGAPGSRPGAGHLDAGPRATPSPHRPASSPHRPAAAQASLRRVGRSDRPGVAGPAGACVCRAVSAPAGDRPGVRPPGRPRPAGRRRRSPALHAGRAGRPGRCRGDPVAPVGSSASRPHAPDDARVGCEAPRLTADLIRTTVPSRPGPGWRRGPAAPRATAAPRPAARPAAVRDRRRPTARPPRTPPPRGRCPGR